MGFVVGVVAALLVVFLLGYITIKKPAFGETVIAVSIVLIALSTYLYFQQDNRLEKKKALIPNSEIVISDINYAYDYGNYFKLTGSIKNLSNRYRLQAILVKISFYRCPDYTNKEANKEANKKDIIEVIDESCEFIEDKELKIKTRLAKAKSGQFETYVLLDKNKFIPLIWKLELISGVAR